MDSKILLGIIAITIFASFAVSGMFVQAGFAPIEMIEVVGNQAFVTKASGALDSIAVCPSTHQLISGDYQVINQDAESGGLQYQIGPEADFGSNSYNVRTVIISGDASALLVTAIAHCGKINFPMNMGMAVGGELLDINTLPLLVGAIGTNPIITALVGITLVGVAGQAVWFVHRRKKNNSS